MEDQVKQILKVLIYIEGHFQDEMSVEELARVACYSSFHFQRLFRFIVGESVHKYVRRLRLERAKVKLLHSDQSITEIALDANFETPSAFTKAFKQCEGKTPRDYRLLYKEMSIVTTKKLNDLAMIEPNKVKDIQDVPVFCIRRTGNYDISATEAWDAMIAFIKENKLDGMKLRYFSMGRDDPKIVEEEKLRFDVCIQIPKDQSISLKGEAVRKTLKGGKYAIFICYCTREGTVSKMIVETFNRIFLKWLPDSKETYDENRFCFMEHSGVMIAIYVPLI